MRVMVLSDTHGNFPLALRAIDEAEQYDQIVHLGDEIDDACMIERIIGRDLIKIPGNCDYTTAFPRECCLTLGDMRIFLTHGDKYQVKSGLSLLYKKALSKRAQIVLYGHSHNASVDTINGILFINPGAMNRGNTPPTCAVLTIKDQESKAEIISLKESKE